MSAAGDRAQQAAVDAAEQVRTDDVDEIVLSTGIVLELRPVPPFAIRRASQSIERPEVPKAWIENKERWEENPNDPAYAEALEDYERLVYEATVNLAMIVGSHVASIPDGYYGPDDEQWIEELEAAGITVDGSNPSRRKLSWLLYYAMATPDDITGITARVLDRAGLREVEVAMAIASFLSHAGRRAHRDAEAESERADGDRVPVADAGDGP
jgi:hypothetical protein